ncbi:MAG: phosphoesterase [Desulfamplus sp.]|nr:phosphoesterase [Desulfamplus sp.]
MKYRRSVCHAEKVLCISRTDFPVEWVGDKSIIRMDEDVFFAAFSKPDFCLHWLDRPSAEKDKNFKQIIPYIIIQAESGNLTAIYRRKGSESRLHDLWSIGIGGHINPLDNSPSSISPSSNSPSSILPSSISPSSISPSSISPSSISEYNNSKAVNHSTDDFHYGTEFKQILYSGMCRELDEELLSRPQKESIPIFLGIINEEHTDVGGVHFGVVFRICSDSSEQFIPGSELVDFQWVKTEDLLTNNSFTATNSFSTTFNLELWSQMVIALF